MGELPAPTVSAGPEAVGDFFFRLRVPQGSTPSNGPPSWRSSSHVPSR